MRVPVFGGIEVSKVINDLGMFETGRDGGVGNTTVLNDFGNWIDSVESA